jgi:hypothetical protein
VTLVTGYADAGAEPVLAADPCGMGVLRGEEVRGREAVGWSQSTSDRIFFLQLNFICIGLVMTHDSAQHSTSHSAYKIFLVRVQASVEEIIHIRIVALLP